MRQAVSGGLHQIPLVCETERLLLTPWRAGDETLLAGLHSTPETCRFVSTGAPWSVSYAAERIDGWMNDYEAKGIGKLKLVARDDGRFIGRAGFSWSKESGQYELGYSICHDEWGKGFATEIATGLKRWFFEQALGAAFIAFAHIDNAASLAVLRKTGFTETEQRDYKGRPFQFFECVAPE
ncbi:GNAT family N-acetyltransferase [Agrobacterium vitis]|uniref:GNAT family N-acetyltransferase n=1 Tax=Agrobacterium vitis TaxID=373 RepID=UPI00307E7A9E